MGGMEISGCNFDGEFSSLVYEEDLQDNSENPSYSQSNQDKQQVSTHSMTPWRHCSLAAVSLALLAAVLLTVDIGLGVHCKSTLQCTPQDNKLTDTLLTSCDPEHVNNELAKLQDTYKTANETLQGVKKQLDSEMSRQKPINWELEHQTRRSKDYEVQLVKMTQDLAALRYQLPMINDGCRLCPPGWILMNSMCYYFSFSDNIGKSWKNARDYCQLYGGDLAVIDSKDKENATVNHLMTNKRISQITVGGLGFWIGLRDFHKEGSWKWVDGTILFEGYWNDGEPNNNRGDQEDCGAVLARENFFQAWNDVKCGTPQKWICEKAPASMS
ncbi:C-type lectin domain family 4 member G-like [Cottoperca gobio]|uniref:C-type lectin domain family 4 member G-like n=1 Tax=Cottoperca gobio TaxID=56716 RepID=A0A6J2S5A5_COTGO|nr:C-type lectin domain family 4 member G-like [Cottoperca gobio]